jgi:hypothetical protein
MLNGFGAHYTIHDTHYTQAQIDGLQEISKKLDAEEGKKTIAYRREMMCEHVIDHEKLIIPEWRPEFEMEWRDPVISSSTTSTNRWIPGRRSWTDLRVAGHYDLEKAWLVH